MDHRGEKEAEHGSQESSDHLHKHKDDTAAAVPEGVHRESSTDQRDDGQYEAETAGLIKEEQVEVKVIEEEASAAPLLAHACSLIQLLLPLRACVGCLVVLLHAYCSDNKDPKPAADDDVAAAAVDAELPTQEGEGAGDDDKAAATGGEVATQVLAPWRPPLPPPGPPEEGSGGHGGSHN